MKQLFEIFLRSFTTMRNQTFFKKKKNMTADRQVAHKDKLLKRIGMIRLPGQHLCSERFLLTKSLNEITLPQYTVKYFLSLWRSKPFSVTKAFGSILTDIDNQLRGWGGGSVSKPIKATIGRTVTPIQGLQRGGFQGLTGQPVQLKQ